MLGFYDAWSEADRREAEFYRGWDEALAEKRDEQFYKDWAEAEQMDEKMYEDWREAEKNVKKGLKKRKLADELAAPKKEKKRKAPEECEAGAKAEVVEPLIDVKIESETDATSYEGDQQAELAHYLKADLAHGNQDRWTKEEWDAYVKTEESPTEAKQEPTHGDEGGTQNLEGEMTDHIDKLHHLLLNTMVNDAVRQAHAMSSVPDGLQTKAKRPLAKAMPAMPKAPVSVAKPPSSCPPPWQQGPLPPPPVPPPTTKNPVGWGKKDRQRRWWRIDQLNLGRCM